MSYTKRAIRGSALIFVIGILASAISYATIVFLARRLGTHDYGLFNAVFTFVLFFLFFRDLGLPQALTKYIVEYQTQKKYNEIKTAIAAVFSFELLSSVFIALFFFFSADFLAVVYFKDPLSSLILKLLIVYLFGSVFFGTFKDIFLGFQQIFLFSFTEFMKNISVFLFVVLFFYLGQGALAPVFAYVLTSVVISLFFLPFVVRKFNFFNYKITNYNKISTDLILFSLPVFATAAGGKVIAYVDTLLLTYYRSLPEVGIYNAVLPSSMIFTHFVAGAIASMVFPLSSELWYKNDVKKLAEGVRLLYKYLFMFTIPLVFPVIVFAHYFILLFFGTSYLPGVLAFQILSLGMFLWTLASINNNILTAIGKPKEVMKIIFYAAILNFGLNIIVIPRYGIEGAAVATTLSYVIGLLLSTFKLCSILELSFPWKQWLLLGILASCFSFVMFGFMQFIHWPVIIAILISIFISVLIYVMLLFCFRLIDIIELKKYFKLVFQK